MVAPPAAARRRAALTPRPPPESKRNRAIKRAADERKQREQKETEIAKLKTALLAKNQEEKELKSQVDANMKYQHFLSDVIECVRSAHPHPPAPPTAPPPPPLDT